MKIYLKNVLSLEIRTNYKDKPFLTHFDLDNIIASFLFYRNNPSQYSPSFNEPDLENLQFFLYRSSLNCSESYQMNPV